MNQNLSLLRRQIRQKRRRLSVFQQRQSEQKLLAQFRRLPIFHQSQHIGIYLDAFGEVRTRQIILACFKQSKNVYLPMVCNMNQHLVWIKITQQQYLNQRFALHHLGMKQAMHSRGQSIQSLDLVCMPLLACDLKGHRIGMGGGFYDKTLSRAGYAPYRLGLAHDFQVLEENIQPQTWDQALDAVLTPTKSLLFKAKHL